jgi:hypothetical protein
MTDAWLSMQYELISCVLANGGGAGQEYAASVSAILRSSQGDRSLSPCA